MMPAAPYRTREGPAPPGNRRRDFRDAAKDIRRPASEQNKTRKAPAPELPHPRSRFSPSDPHSLREQFRQFGLEALDVAKRAVHARETDIGDRIERL